MTIPRTIAICILLKNGAIRPRVSAVPFSLAHVEQEEEAPLGEDLSSEEEQRQERDKEAGADSLEERIVVAA